MTGWTRLRKPEAIDEINVNDPPSALRAVSGWAFAAAAAAGWSPVAWWSAAAAGGLLLGGLRPTP